MSGLLIGQHSPVRFVVTADGVAPIRLGMGRQDAGLALIEWGEPQPFRRGSEPVAGWIVERSSTTVFVYCDDDERVEAIEFASPGHGQPADDEVMFENVDLFVDPADVVIANLSAKGHAITHEQNGFASTLPDVLLALWRDGEPRDEVTGLPLYFESALVARPGYDG